MRTVPACRSTAPQGRAHASDTRSPQRNLKRKRRRSRRASRPGKTATRAASGLAVGTPWGTPRGGGRRRPGCRARSPASPKWAQPLARRLRGVCSVEGAKPAVWPTVQEPGHPAGTGLQGGRGIALGGQRGERREEARLMQGTAGRERRVLRLGPRTIPGILSWRLGHQAHSLEDSEDCRHNWPTVPCQKSRPSLLLALRGFFTPPYWTKR
jgi:hypothetical protein